MTCSSRCRSSKTPPETCRCPCAGEHHGANVPPEERQRAAPKRSPAPPKRRKGRRRVVRARPNANAGQLALALTALHVVEVDVGGSVIRSRPLDTKEATLLWHEQRALGRRVRVLPGEWNERPPWLRDGVIRSVLPPGSLEYEGHEGNGKALGPRSPVVAD